MSRPPFRRFPGPDRRSPRPRAIAVVAALATLTFATATAPAQPAGNAVGTGNPQPAAPANLQEVRPEVFYLKDDAGGLVPVPGFRYRDFIELLRLKEGLPQPPQPPPAVIASVSVDGTIGDDGCRSILRMKVVQADDGWVGVPVALAGFRPTEPPAYEGKGRLLLDAEKDPREGYRGWFEGRTGDEHTVTLRGVFRVDRSVDQEAVTIDLPRAGGSQVVLRTRLDAPIVEVDPPRAEPKVMRAERPPAESRPTASSSGGAAVDEGTTGTPSSESPSREAAAAETDGGSVITLVGIAGPTRILVRSRTAAAPDRSAASQAVGEIVVRIDGRRAISDVSLDLTGLAAGTRTVAVRLPGRGAIVGVRPPSTLVETRGGAAEVEALFAVTRGPKGEASLRFECETPVEKESLDGLAFRVAGIPDWRQWGRVSLLVDGDWQVTWAAVSANRRVDPPATIEGGRCIAAFAYDAQPARLPLQVKPLGSRVVIEPEYGYSVGGTRIELDARLRVSVGGRPITEIELVLDGWGIEAVGPSNLVDGDAVRGEAGRLTIPFVKPFSGNGTIELRAARTIARSDQRVAWTLPVPRASLVGPAAVTILTDSDIELVPDAQGIRGLTRQSASARGSDAVALAYRLDGTAGQFAAARRFLPRHVDLGVSTHAAVDRTDTVVEQTIRYDVAHVPLGTVSLAVPRIVFESGGLQVRQQDVLLNLRPAAEESTTPAGDGDSGGEPPAVVRLLAELPSPRLGGFDLKVNYGLRTPDVPSEATVSEDLPLVMPLDGRVSRQSFSVESQGGLAVDVRGDKWKRDASPAGPSSGRSWTSGKPQEFAPLAIAAERPTVAASSIVEAAWLETMLLPDRREDLFRYRIESTAATVELVLPETPSASDVEVRLDGRTVVGGIQPGGRIVVDLAAGGVVGERLLEIERVQPRPSLFERLLLDPPQFVGSAQQRRFYWEVRLETDEHVVVGPRRWTSQQGWSWAKGGLVRRPVVSRESLARWIKAREDSAVAVDDDRELPAIVARRAVYSGIGWPGKESIWIAPTWLLVACISGPVLMAGLAVVYRPTSRTVPAAVALGVAWAAVAFTSPDLLPLAVQCAVPGLALTLLAGVLRVAVAPRSTRFGGPGSPSLIIAGGSTRAVATPSPAVAAGSSARDLGPTEAVVVAMLLCGVVGTCGRAAEPLRYMKVHVPDDRSAARLFGDVKHVPVPLAEFDAAVARSGGAVPEAALRRLPRVAYRLEWRAGELTGSVEFEVDRGIDRFPLVVPIGGLRIDEATVESRDGTGVATVAGLPDGRIGVFVRQPGTYRCVGGTRARGTAPSRETTGPVSLGPVSLTLPLIPAITTDLELVLPREMRPIVMGGRATVRPDGIDARGGRRYRIAPGPVDSLDLRLEPDGGARPDLQLVNTVSLSRRRWAVEAVVQPGVRWERRSLEARLDPGLVVTGVSVLADVDGGPLPWAVGSNGRELQVRLPSSLVGSRAPLVVTAVAPFDGKAAERVPIVRLDADAWASGSIVVSLDETTTFTAIEVEEASLVETPIVGDSANRGERQAVPATPRIAVEQSSSQGAVRVAVAARVPEFDTARVTTVDISAAAVTARTLVNVRVGRGEAFDLKGRIGPQWLIDSVEAAGESVPLEWVVDASSSGSVLRVGLVRGISAGRELTLRLVGHRAVLPQGKGFPASSLDMIRFEGEAAGEALIDIRTNAETTILSTGGVEPTRSADELPTRMRALLEPGVPRARLPAGEHSSNGEITILRRRPPVDVWTQIAVTSRDDLLAESFTFDCSPRDSEIDSLVVFFSEPSASPTDWSVLAPSTSKVSARRIENDPRQGKAVGMPQAAETWLVELAPPSREAVSIRAVRSEPFPQTRRVPLAWVEGAPTHRGEVTVRDAGRGRPSVVSSRLPEIPGRGTASDRAGMPVAAFLFDVARDLPADGRAAIELAPQKTASRDARAWAWSETTTTWCDESGGTEYETSFVIENHGRGSVTLELPADKRLEAVLLDGDRIEPLGSEAAGGQFDVELPSGKRFVRLDLRMVAKPRPVLGWWTVDASAGQIDLPVMERAWLLGLPPQVEIAMASSRHRLTDATIASWPRRLIGFTASRERAPYVMHRFVPVEGLASGATVTLVRSTTVWRAAIAIALLGLAAGWGLARHRVWVIWIGTLVCGLAVLWSVSPWFAIARSLLLGLLSGAAVQIFRGRVAAATVPAVAPATMAFACVIAWSAVATPGLAAEPGQPERVFITPGVTGPIALVPEPVFRALSGLDRGPGSRSVGVVRTRLILRDQGPADRGSWTLEAEIEGGAGDRFTVRQPEGGATFAAGSVFLDGRPLVDAVAADGGSIDIVLEGFGRRVLRVEVRPVFETRGVIEEAVVAMPPATRSTVVMPESWISGDGTPHECEWSGAGAAVDHGWTFAPRETDDGGTGDRDADDPGPVGGESVAFDVTGGGRVRISRAVRRGVTIARRPASVACVQEIDWDEDGCRVRASFAARPSAVDAGDRVCRSIMLDVDPRLVPVRGTDIANDGFRVGRSADGRAWVEWTEPEPREQEASLLFRMPCASPVGIFDAPLVRPAADIESSVEVRVRTSSPSLRLSADLPASVRPIAPLGDDVVGRFVGWSSGGPGAGVSIGVTRREIIPSVTQRLAVAVDQERARWALDARIEADGMPLASVEVAVPREGSVDLVRLLPIAQDPPSTDGEPEPVDIRFLRENPDRLRLLVQRPRAGRYRLAVEGRSPVKPSAKESLPVARVVSSSAGPMAIEVTVASDALLLLGDDTRGMPSASLTLASEAVPPVFRLGGREQVDAEVALPAGSTTAERRPPQEWRRGIESRVELADVRIAVDDLGRTWGVARFDVLATEPSVRLRLPGGFRLFDAFLDGHPATARPVEPGSWEIRVLDTSRPRSLVALFLGGLGDRVASGDAIELAAPAIESMPAAAVLWTIRGPRDRRIRFLTSSGETSKQGFEAARARAVERLRDDTLRALEGRSPEEQDRLRAALDRDESTDPAGPESAWDRSSLSLAPSAHLAAAGDTSSIRFRIARPRDPTLSGRVVGTLCLVAAVAAAWRMSLSGRHDAVNSR